MKPPLRRSMKPISAPFGPVTSSDIEFQTSDIFRHLQTSSDIFRHQTSSDIKTRKAFRAKLRVLHAFAPRLQWSQDSWRIHHHRGGMSQVGWNEIPVPYNGWLCKGKRVTRATLRIQQIWQSHILHIGRLAFIQGQTTDVLEAKANRPMFWKLRRIRCWHNIWEEQVLNRCT